MAVKTYKPNYVYYTGNAKPKSTDLVYLFTVSDSSIIIYSFMVFKKQELKTVTDPTIGTSSQKIDSTKYNFISDISGFLEYKGGKFHNYISEENGKINLISFKELENLYNFYEKNPGNITDLDNIYLRPYYSSISTTLPKYTADPNVDFRFTSTTNVGAILENLNVITKQDNEPKYYSNYGDIIIVNSGLANQTSFLNLNYIVCPTVKSFFSNLKFTSDLNYNETTTDFYYDNMLKLKIDGPSTGSVGDILEYNVSLSDYSGNNTWKNLPDIEVYPTVDAGILSHRKITLVKGIGKFKVDTSHLYSGETFDIKIGWKYLTSDNKVNVKLS